MLAFYGNAEDIRIVRVESHEGADLAYRLHSLLLQRWPLLLRLVRRFDF